MPRILRTPWTSQPQVQVDIDWANPITLGLIDVAQFNGNLYNPARYTFGSGSVAYSATQSGIKLSLPGTGSGFPSFSTPIKATTQLTILAFVIPSSLSSYPAICGRWENASGRAFKLAASFNGTGTPYFDIGGAAGTGDNYRVSSVAISTGVLSAICGVFYGGSTQDIYINGRLANGSLSGSIQSSLYQSVQPLRIGVNDASGALPFNGKVGPVYIFNRALSATEVKSLSDNPWQIFTPARHPLYFDLGAGGDLNITASLGTASATGHAATVDRQRTIAASLGTATAQGYGATISFDSDLNIAASLGLASADGHQANVNLQRDIAASLGTAAALGYQATVFEGDPLHGFTQDQLDFLVAYMEANMAVPTTSEIATAIYANTIDGKTLTQHIRLLSAVLGGKVSGAGTGTETFRDIADTKDRLVVTVDSSGNRTAITRDLD